MSKKAKLWLYSNNVGAINQGLAYSNNVASINQGLASENLVLEALKHWAVVVELKKKNSPDQIDKTIIFEAYQNKDGLLCAEESAFGEDDEDEWKKRPGFRKETHGEIDFCQEDAKTCVRDFNEEKMKYVATSANCQMFVKLFLAELQITIRIPTTVEEAKSMLLNSSHLVSGTLKSLSEVSVKKIITSRIGGGALNALAKEAIENINMFGFGKISLLTESPIKEYMEKEGKKLVLTTLGELTENRMNAVRGAFSWFNLIQIPVELLVGNLLKSYGFKELEQYAGKKLASCLTAATVGAFTGGPFGLLGSLAFWIAAEVVATMVRCAMCGIFGENIVDKSDTVELVRNIFNFCVQMLDSGIWKRVQFGL